MPIYGRHFEPGQLQFITTSTYRRTPVFSIPSFPELFVQALRAARSKFGFALVGWVLMPEHFHLLFRPWPPEATPEMIKNLKQRSAHAVLEALQARQATPACRLALRAFSLPPTVHDHAHFRVWQRRYIPFNVYTEKKRLEKLDYMHSNPVRRRLVSSPGDWPWSSWRFYFLGDRSTMEMDRVS
jgi:putative transposase